jgi:hypothetical protein
MIDIPYSVLYWIYLLGVLAILVFAFFNLYHLLRFGFRTTVNVTMTFALIAGTVIILFISYSWLQGLDWSRYVHIEIPIDSLSPFWNL